MLMSSRGSPAKGVAVQRGFGVNWGFRWGPENLPGLCRHPCSHYTGGPRTLFERRFKVEKSTSKLISIASPGFI